MKAIFYRNYGSPGVLKLEELEKPVPGDNEVRIRIRAAAVSTTDCAFRKGEPLIRLFFGLRRPKKNVLGTEFAGEVEAVGRDVTRFRVGDPVYAASGTDFGAHAEYICLPEDGAVATKPANTSYGEAAAVCEGSLTALPFLRDKGNIQGGQSVLINGASGAVGASAVQLARYFGAEVTGVCGPTSLELVRSLGADKVIDYTREDFTKSGQTYDIIFDAIGKSSFSRCKGSLKRGGVYLSTVLTLPTLLQTLWTSKIGSRKAKLAATGMRPPAEKTADLAFLKELVEAGEIKPVVDRSYPLEQAADAHRHVETGHKKGSVVITLEN